MSETRTVAVTGASGLVGSALSAEFESDGVRVLRMVRRAARNASEVSWDPARGEIDPGPLEGVDSVFHLAGRNLATDRWTPQVKREIALSRTKSTRLIAEAIAGLTRKPRVLVCASAIGFYGDRGAPAVDEDSPPGTGFLAETCREWEASNQPAWEAGIRVAQARIGVVLSPEGGLLKKLLPIFRKGLGGVVGRGDQYMSWISLPDLTRALRFIGDVDSMHGAVNAVAPGAVTNRQFTKALGKKLGKPTLLPVPAAVVKLAMGEMGDEIALAGANIKPKRLAEAGFRFETPELPAALDRVLDPPT